MKRKGFTLVELLIVIVVIGILSAMMMLSSTEATTSAKATAIVSNLRNLKTAALGLYSDKIDYFTKTKASDVAKYLKNDGKGEIWEYLSSGSDIPDKDNYKLGGAESNGGEWWVQCKITGSTAEQASIKKKLAGRAKSLGLKGLSKWDDAIPTPEKAADFDAAQHNVVMLRVR